MIRVISADRRLITFAAATLAAGASVMWSARAIAVKGVGGLIEVGALIVVPVAAWIAWVRPLLFPYGLYAVLAPLDILTQMSHQGGTVTRLVGIAAAPVLLLYSIRTRSVRTPPRAIVWLALLCGWMLLSTLWSQGSDAGREAMTLLQLAIMYTVIATFPTQRRDFAPLFGAILLGGLISAAIGIYDFHSGGIREAQSLENFSRITITLGSDTIDPNMYGDSLLLPFGVALLWFIRTRYWGAKLFTLAAMATMLVPLALVGSRDATIGLAIVVTVLTVVLRAWKRVALPVLGVTAGVIALFPNVIVRAIEDQGNGGSGRTSIWQVGLDAFLHHPLIGSGAGSYGDVYDHWYLRIYERVDPGWHMASHDILLHYGVELGIVGLIFVIGWCVAQGLLVRALPREGIIGDVRTLCMASLVAFAFVAFFIDVFDLKFVWLVFGLVAQARNTALYDTRTT
jgi:O-antigen ligase